MRRFDFLATAISENSSDKQTVTGGIQEQMKIPSRPRKRRKQDKNSLLAPQTEETRMHQTREQQSFVSFAEASAGNSFLEGEDEEYD